MYTITIMRQKTRFPRYNKNIHLIYYRVIPLWLTFWSILFNVKYVHIIITISMLECKCENVICVNEIFWIKSTNLLTISVSSLVINHTSLFWLFNSCKLGHFSFIYLWKLSRSKKSRKKEILTRFRICNHCLRIETGRQDCFMIEYYYKWLSHVSIDISIGQKNFKRKTKKTWKYKGR
jgi:hypothetical protein